MKNTDSWSSAFRKQKFYENQRRKKDKHTYEEIDGVRVVDSFHKQENVIVVLLDLQGTCDFIDYDKAKCFVRQINKIRNKFQADGAVICISTHDPDSRGMKKVFDILSSSLPHHTKIGTSFFYGGTYDYSTDTEICRRPFFNSNKLETFKSHYLNNSDYFIPFFAVIDDSASDNIYKEFQQKKAMFLCKPSQSENELFYNNFMRIATTTYGFDGVIEGIDCYINSIQKLTPNEILNEQKHMLRHLSSIELGEKILDRDFTFLEKYFDLGYADTADYNYVLQAILVTLKKLKPSPEECEIIRNILSIVRCQFASIQDEKSLEKVKLLQEQFRI